ncbi:MAG: ABC transporter ATP-binding protein [Fervidobacterium sp.]|uniref:Iron(III) transport system ATP-binding protein n=1 Tax=Fervidobacterium gondwanense DSM 13020 TaxID=1121883 RepID=A0A1M7SKF6_FERGO|nr:ABC transporter ATP-binding protein [Fervidobacterium gondwanense]SHN58947.1 iron(III) transport system ATP-binding protein [Fervidobacterium gondwanense DSM 13020]
MFLEIKDLYFRYRNSKDYALKNVNFSVEEGEIICILGESGSGKSTLLRLISGLEIPQQGSIRIAGKTMVDDVTFVPPEKRNVGFVFQDYVLFPHLNVSQNILFGVREKDKSKREEILYRILKMLKIEELRDRYPYQLSGGQQQRVALARALAMDPSMVLLDEPFSNLDATLQESIRREIKDIIKSTGKTCIFVSHDKEDAIELADKIAIIHKGEIIFYAVNSVFRSSILNQEIPAHLA